MENIPGRTCRYSSGMKIAQKETDSYTDGQQVAKQAHEAHKIEKPIKEILGVNTVGE